jgi:anhydro-N-acetylmuramic acid kinase
MRVLGFMTGTSLDAVDMAVLETDGEAILAYGPAGERRLTDATRGIFLDATREALAWPRGAATPGIFAAAARAGAEEHFAAAQAFLARHGLSWSDLDLIGMHGQTVLHERPQAGRLGRTVQLADAQWLADRTGVPVAFDFRTSAPPTWPRAGRARRWRPSTIWRAPGCRAWRRRSPCSTWAGWPT